MPKIYLMIAFTALVAFYFKHQITRLFDQKKTYN